MPPELMDMLQQAQQGGVAPPDAMGGPPDQIDVTPPGQTDQSGQNDLDPEEMLKQMLDLADEYKTSESDEEDVLAIEKVSTLIQQLLAKQQKERDGLAQGKMTPSAVRRSYASQ